MTGLADGLLDRDAFPDERHDAGVGLLAAKVSFVDSVEQYLQWRDSENFGPEAPDMIRDIWKKLQVSK